MNLVEGTPVGVDRVEGTRLDQRFDQPPIECGQRHTANEVHEVDVPAVAALTLGNDVGDCLFTHVPDGTESETHHITDGGVGVHGFVDIRREYLDAHAARLA